MPIRRPTTEEQSLAWWRSALSDPHTVRHDGQPECGYYARRYYKNGPLVPVHVRLSQVIDPVSGELTEPERLVADELGRRVDPVRVWTYLRPISRDDFDALVERHRFDQRMAATHTRYDLTAAPMRP